MTTPIPEFFNPQTVGEIWRVPYQQRAEDAIAYRQQHSISPAQISSKKGEQPRVCLLAIDVQNTFCVPDFELFVGGRSGMGAVNDTRRLCEFIYRNLAVITEIIPTMDTHSSAQIFHPVFWVNEAGEHPAPMTMIAYEDVAQKKWRVNPDIASSLAAGHLASQHLTSENSGTESANTKNINANNISAEDIEAFAHHYAKQLSDRGKYPLTIWPYHSMLGGIGHALVPAFEEACFFHNMVRSSPTRFEAKGDNPLTENYSVLSPEVLTNASGQVIAQKNNRLIQYLLDFDAIIIAGQAKSHCVAWTVSDLLAEIQGIDSTMTQKLTQKIYLLEDCTSPVVVPGVIDFTDEADCLYHDFEKSGMNRVLAVDSIESWPAFPALKE
ncbi:MAG: isochorismatase [Cyanobacteria bacterium J06621_11]